MTPVVHEIAAVDHLFVMIFRVFHGITALYPTGNGGKCHIVPAFIHHAAFAEEQTEAPAQGENGGIAALPDSGGFPHLYGIIVPFFQSLGLFRPQVLVVNVHGILFPALLVVVNQPFDKLFEVVKLEIVLPQEGLFSVQIFPEIRVIVLIGLIQGIADFRIP